MFYDKFVALCRQRGLSPNRACIEMGFSRALAAKWKTTGSTPNGATLNAIAAYFGVSADFLLSVEEKAPPPSSEQAEFTDKLFAAYGSVPPSEYDEDDYADLALFMRMVDERKKKKARGND